MKCNGRTEESGVLTREFHTAKGSQWRCRKPARHALFRFTSALWLTPRFAAWAIHQEGGATGAPSAAKRPWAGVARRLVSSREPTGRWCRTIGWGHVRLSAAAWHAKQENIGTGGAIP